MIVMSKKDTCEIYCYDEEKSESDTREFRKRRYIECCPIRRYNNLSSASFIVLKVI
jgi:hypothetical protein